VTFRPTIDLSNHRPSGDSAAVSSRKPIMALTVRRGQSSTAGRTSRTAPRARSSKVLATSAAIAAVQAALPDVDTMAAISRTVAAVERFGVPALVSSSPLSQAEAAQLLRDPPRLSPADEAAFAAAARDLSLKGSPCPASRSN
jgi:hypothetical protein